MRLLSVYLCGALLGLGAAAGCTKKVKNDAKPAPGRAAMAHAGDHASQDMKPRKARPRPLSKAERAFVAHLKSKGFLPREGYRVVSSKQNLGPYVLLTMIPERKVITVKSMGAAGHSATAGLYLERSGPTHRNRTGVVHRPTGTLLTDAAGFKAFLTHFGFPRDRTRLEPEALALVHQAVFIGVEGLFMSAITDVSDPFLRQVRAPKLTFAKDGSATLVYWYSDRAWDSDATRVTCRIQVNGDSAYTLTTSKPRPRPRPKSKSGAKRPPRGKR